MHLYTRRARLRGGNGQKGLTWATDIARKASQVSGAPIALHGAVYSPAFGSLVWSTFVPDLEAMETLGDKLSADDGYLTMADEGATYTDGMIDDSLSLLVHGAPDPDRPGEYVSVVQAVTAAGHAADGVLVGIELAQRAEAITGLPTMFLTNETGAYGGVAWITGYPNIGGLDAGQQALLADPSWVDLIDTKAGGVYAEDASVTTQTFYRRFV